MGQGPVSPSYIHKIFVSYAADTETTRWEKLMACSPYASRPQTGWSQKVDDADSHLLPQINQKNFHELIMFSLNHYYKTSHFPFQVGTHRLRPTAGFSLLHPKLSLWGLIWCQGTEPGFSFSWKHIAWTKNLFLPKFKGRNISQNHEPHFDHLYQLWVDQFLYW